jgi:tryptophan synthase alpha subunit
VGFGLRTGDDLRHIQGLADIGTVGTALLAAWEEGGAARYETFLQELRAATTD